MSKCLPKYAAAKTGSSEGFNVFNRLIFTEKGYAKQPNKH